MANRPIYFNGRFLAKPITGSERFAREVVWAFDALLAERNSQVEVKLLAPKGTPEPEGLTRIGMAVIGSLRGHAWEQLELLMAARRGQLVSLVSCGPILHPRQLTMIHDAAIFRYANNFSFSYRTLHRTLGHALAMVSKIGTVSEFSRKEVSEVLRLQPAKMPILPNGHEHILRVQPEMQILEQLGVRQRPYFLFVGSPVPNKNLARAVEAFQRLNRSDMSFILVGAANSRVFATKFSLNQKNIIMPGRLSDGEIAALYRGAKALVFPSLYEGFGIPPLEAMTLGCPVIASRIPAVMEVCADAALYFDPFNVDDITVTMQRIIDSPELAETLVANGVKRYPMFSWRKSASVLFDTLQIGSSS